MSIRFRRPIPGDFRSIDLQPYDKDLEPHIRRHAVILAERAKHDPFALTCVHDGRVVGIGGVLATGEAWQFFAADCRRAMPAMLREIRKAIIQHVLTDGSVWAIIDPDRPNARRWAALLGFDHVEGSLWRIKSSDLLPS